MKTELKVLDGGAENKPLDEAQYKNIINENFDYIEKQCFNAVRLRLKDFASKDTGINIENEALELSNRVLDTLQKDNYRVLRGFKGNARITTYITAIISRQAVDLIRKKLGRGREKERAKELGDIGLHLYQRVLKDGCPLPGVFRELQNDNGFTGSLEDLEAMVQKIKGKRKKRGQARSVLLPAPACCWTRLARPWGQMRFGRFPKLPGSTNRGSRGSLPLALGEPPEAFIPVKGYL